MGAQKEKKALKQGIAASKVEFNGVIQFAGISRKYVRTRNNSRCAKKYLRSFCMKSPEEVISKIEKKTQNKGQAPARHPSAQKSSPVKHRLKWMFKKQRGQNRKITFWL